MTTVSIVEEEFGKLKDQVVIITGASSGIGLATLRRVISHGGKVFAADVNPLPEPEAQSVPFRKTDVASWAEQVALFKAAEQEYEKIDHVFANAGIAPTETILEDTLDENGDLKAPDLSMVDVNLIGCLYTVKLGVYNLKKNQRGGSIVMTGSGASFAKHPGPGYTVSKHGILGLLRSLSIGLYPYVPIRLNAVAPGWTETNMLPQALLDALGPGRYQSPDAVARAVVSLMTADARHAELMFVDRGSYVEMENGEKGHHDHVKRMLGITAEQEKKLLGVALALKRAEEEKEKQQRE